jgi:Ca2+-binding RTX toxin-like protein
VWIEQAGRAASPSARAVRLLHRDRRRRWHLELATGKLAGQIHSCTESSTDLAGNTGLSAGVTLYAPSAHKSLQGGSGNDVLIAGSNDTLMGGDGSDTFVFNPSFGKVTVKDFNASQDVLAFAKSLFPKRCCAGPQSGT